MQFFAINVDVNVSSCFKPSVLKESENRADNAAGAGSGQKFAAASAAEASARDNSPQWGIREFAKMFDVTPRTLRFYEDKGLIAPDRRSGGRVYGARDYVRAERVIRAKDLGFSLDDIRALFEVMDGDVDGKTELLRRKGRMTQAVSDLRRRRINIDSAVSELDILIKRIDDYVQTAPEDGVFQNAAAYDAIFSRTLSGSDNFSPLTPLSPAQKI